MEPVERLVRDAPGVRSRKAWRWLEAALWTCGLAGVGVWGFAQLSGTAGARADREHFRALQAAVRSPAAGSLAQPDLSLWDIERIEAWRASLGRPAPAPVAILRIPKMRLEVAVLPGTDDFVLNRAVGHIEGTAAPGAPGNAGIAGHRDGFFRGLKDIVVGDLLEIDTTTSRGRYRVTRTWIVYPEDVSVLDPTPEMAVTLVTCYPFYFTGPAPQRFIVRAVQIPEPAGERPL